MVPITPAIQNPLEDEGRTLLRRNRAESLVRDRLTSLNRSVYVLRSSWHQNGRGPEPLVAVIARTGDSRELAQQALGDVAGLSEQGWMEAWKPLSLDDWMIWVFPERAGREAPQPF